MAAIPRFEIVSTTSIEPTVALGDHAPPERRIRGFDGLRAIAFLLVFVSHKTGIRYNERYGDIGVWLFFVLSGFLITRILASARAAIERGDTRFSEALARFYLRRTARIFPIYYLVLAFFTACTLFVTVDHFGRNERLAYWLYATNVLVELRHGWIGDFGHFWSLAIEEQFYILFAPIVLLARRAHTRTVCIAFLAAGISTKVAMEALGASPISIDVDSFVNFTLLAFGGWIGLSADRPAPRPLVGAGAMVAVFVLYLALPSLVGTHFHAWYVFGKLSGLLAGALLLQIDQGQDSIFVRALESPPLRGLGRITYAAYLFHPFIHFSAAQHLLGFEAVPTLPKWLQLAVELATTITLAALSWRYIERPVLDRAARVTMRKSEPTAAPGS